MNILIPARAGSKGLPGKNKRLLKYTVKNIPKELYSQTYISTDDEEIKNMVPSGMNIHHRSPAVSCDTASTLSLVKEFVNDFKISGDVIMLYLTYPQRTHKEVAEVYDFFLKNKIKSLLCKKDVETSPYLCMFELPNGKGRQIVEHDLYRRQDYPKCFEITHYISIFNTDEVEKLNNNLYNNDTYFYEIGQKIDVDHQKDLDNFLKSKENKNGEER